jgi:uncharacterized protein
VRVVLDTNVFVAGVFWLGPPYKILQAWRDGRLALVVTAGILQEYERIGKELSAQFPHINFAPFIELLTVEAELCPLAKLSHRVCDDPDDDLFIACALGGNVPFIVTGDKKLLKADGYQGLTILRPADFANRYL